MTSFAYLFFLRVCRQQLLIGAVLLGSICKVNRENIGIENGHVRSLFDCVAVHPMIANYGCRCISKPRGRLSLRDLARLYSPYAKDFALFYPPKCSFWTKQNKSFKFSRNLKKIAF